MNDGGNHTLPASMPGEAIVTVITVCLNAESTILDCLTSVACQDDPHVEHLLVDGGSRDGTMDLVRSFQNDKLRLVEQRDSGIYDAMNRALGHVAPDRWVIFLNSDDRLSGPQAVSRLRPLLDEADMVCSRIRWISMDGFPLLEMGMRPSLDSLAMGMVAHHQGIVARRALFESVGRFDTGFRIGGDYDWLVRVVSSRAVIGFHDECLSEVRLEGRSERAQSTGAFDRARVALRHFRGWRLFRALFLSVLPELARIGFREFLRWIGLLGWLRRVRGIHHWRPR